MAYHEWTKQELIAELDRRDTVAEPVGVLDISYDGDQPTIDTLPTSSRAADVRTALRMVDAASRERTALRAENQRLRAALEARA